MAKGRPNKGTGTTGPKKPGNSNDEETICITN